MTDTTYYFNIDTNRLYVDQLTIRTGFTYTGPNYNNSGYFLQTDGSGIATWQPALISTITNNVNNYVITATATASVLNGESNLQFDGSNLNVVGGVAIGNTVFSPSQLLHLQKTNANAYVLVETTSASYAAGVQLKNTAGTSYIFKNPATDDLHFQVGGQDRVNIDSSGYFKYVDGNQANGKILTSDTNGVASWQTITAGSSRWTNVTGVTSSGTGFISTSIDQSGLVKVGYPIKYTISSVVYYGIVSGVTSSTISVCGVSPSGLTTTSVYVGTPEMVFTETFLIRGAYADAADTTLLANDLNTYFRWNTSFSYCVMFSVRHKVNAGTTNPSVNVTIDGSAVSTSNTNSGLTVSTAWLSTANDIDSSNYRIQYLSEIEIKTSACSGDNCKDLTLQMVCVKA